MLRRIHWRDSGPTCLPALRLALCFSFAAAALQVAAAGSAKAAPAKPILRTVREVRNLSLSEAADGYPVHFRRVQVLFLSPEGALFFRDSTGGLSADLRNQSSPALHPGDLIDLSGSTGRGDSLPVILRPAIRVLGHAPLPDAADISLGRLSSGAFQSQWVSVEGIVQSAMPVAQGSGNSLRLTLVSGQDQLAVLAQGVGPIQPSQLVDARVRLQGVVANEWNPRKLLIHILLFIPDLSCLQIVEPPPADPFALPVTRVADMTIVALHNPDHRVHVRGVVTSTWGDHDLSLMDTDRGTFVATLDSVRVRLGDVVDVAGFPSDGDFTPYLSGAVVRRAGSAPAPPTAVLSAAQAFRGDHDAEPIEATGELIGQVHSADGIEVLTLSDAGTPFQAVLPPGRSGSGAQAPFAALEPGSRLRVRGICVIHADRDHQPQKLDVLLRSPADVTLLRSPGWWTFGRVAIAAVVLLAMVLIVAIWNAGLRARVRAQTRRIEAQLEEARSLRKQAEAAHEEKSRTLADLLIVQQDLLTAQEKLRYQASHDALTGLWNHPALLEFLHKEAERARRHRTCLGILLLDLDHFKAVNDTHGHLTGDAVLQEVGSRISRAIRPYDIAGRYGGEEFLIILPECGAEETQRSADRIRQVIASTPFAAAASSFTLTTSIGATVAAGSVPSETVLLNQADLALYEAKFGGRNCTRLYTEQTAAQSR